MTERVSAHSAPVAVTSRRSPLRRQGVIFTILPWADGDFVSFLVTSRRLCAILIAGWVSYPPEDT